MTTLSAPSAIRRLARRRDAGFVERHAARAPSASIRSSTSRRRSPLDQRHEAALQAVGRRPGAPAELEHVAKAARRDQADGRDLALEHRVGRRRRAVHDRVERRRVDAGRVERGEHAEGLVVDRRRHLGDAHLAGRGVDDDQVGEGAADVDAGDPLARGAASAFTALRWVRMQRLVAASASAMLPVEAHLALLEHVGAVGDELGEVHVLLGQQDRHALLPSARRSCCAICSTITGATPSDGSSSSTR